ncbi:MAG TPA: glycosyltransferase [Mycobacteriales bacterium]|nr:glycosyltransferase [Mycobacteriales bacterium]
MTARTAVYDRFWRSEGGGERHAGMIAQVLREDGAAVELLGHEDTDVAKLADHLGLDLAGVTYRRLPDRGDHLLSEVSEDYDLFVNGTYTSRLVPRSKRAAYLCFFPTPPDHDLPAWRRWATRTLGPVVRGTTPNLDFGAGWFPPEGGLRRKWIWSSGDGVLTLPGGARVLRANLGRPGAPDATTLTVLDEDGSVLLTLPVPQRFTRQELDLGARAKGTEVRFTSGTYSPGGADTRELGIALSRPRLAGKITPRELLAARFPWLHRDPKDLSWLAGYQAVMANSEYTRGWIRRLWDVDSDVLYPPIATDPLTPVPDGDRELAVLSVGRFFAPGLGHAKRQLEMVETFGALVRAGRLPGWKMYVVGGMEPSQIPYVAKVKAAAEDLPVEILTNAPRPRVEQLLSSCAVFWSATGYGEDISKRPWVAEHFGMTTVEAMAGGCVPVVIDCAGQTEIVRDGVDGYRWQTLEQMGERTVALAGDPAARARLAASARARAAAYDEDAFRARWRAIVAKHGLL